ncbi:hypothetical protein HK096_005935, partial [Nowakowskiella sp. JEL0078]
DNERPVLIQSNEAALLKEISTILHPKPVNSKTEFGIGIKSDESKVNSDETKLNSQSLDFESSKIVKCYFCYSDCSAKFMVATKVPMLKICCDCFADGILPSDMPSSEFARVERVAISDSKMTEVGIGPGYYPLDLEMIPGEDPWTLQEIRRLMDGVEKYCTSLNQSAKLPAEKSGQKSGNKTRQVIDLGVPYMREWSKVAMYVGGKRTKEQCLLTFVSLDMEKIDEWLENNNIPEKPEPDVAPPLADEEEEELLRTLEEAQQASFPTSAASSPKLRRRSTRISAASTIGKDYTEWDEDDTMRNDESGELFEQKFNEPKEPPKEVLKPLNVREPEIDILHEPIGAINEPELEFDDLENLPQQTLSDSNALSQTPIVDVANPVMWLINILKASTNPGIAASAAHGAIKIWGEEIDRRKKEEIGRHLAKLKKMGAIRMELPMISAERKHENDLYGEASKESESTEEEIQIDVMKLLNNFREMGIPINSVEDAEELFGTVPEECTESFIDFPHKKSVRFAETEDITKAVPKQDIVMDSAIMDNLTFGALKAGVEQARLLADFESIVIEELTRELEDAQLSVLELKLKSFV